MSIANVKEFYLHLERNPRIQQEALLLQHQYAGQEEVINAFILLAQREGFPFTLEEFIQVMYENAREVEKPARATSTDSSSSKS